MKTFKIGKTYYVNGGGNITVNKRTKNYIIVSGCTKHDTFKNKRFFIYKSNMFNLGENILIPFSGYKALVYFCFAGHEKEEG